MSDSFFCGLVLGTYIMWFVEFIVEVIDYRKKRREKVKKRRLKMSEFVIAGDTKRSEGCIICTCGTKEHAEEVLKRITENPTETDEKMTKGHTNLRIEEVADEDCWWKRW